jgi:hypothetical protein
LFGGGVSSAGWPQPPPPPDNSAAAATTSTACQLRGTVDGVRGEAQMQKINGPPCVVAKINGVKVGGGGGGLNNAERE